MSISISEKPEQNVVNVGEEITSDQLAAIQNAAGANASNPLETNIGSLRKTLRRNVFSNLTALSTQVTGTGAGYTQLQQYTNITTPNAGVAGFARGFCLFQTSLTGASSNNSFSGNIGFGVFTVIGNTASLVGNALEIGLGYTNSPTAGVALGDLTDKGFGFTWTHGGNVFLQVHDGTTLRLVDTGYAPPTTQNTRVYLEATTNGSGLITGFVKSGTLEYTVTSSNGPTGSFATNSSGFVFQASTNGSQTVATNYGGPHPTFTS